MTSPELDVLNYHNSGWRRLIFNTRLTLWRMGLGGLVARNRVIIGAKGHKTGKPRHTIAPFARHNDQVVIWAGWSKTSHWVKNLTAHPLVTVQVGRQTDACTAERITAEADLRALHPHFASHVGSMDELLAKKDEAHFFKFVPNADKRHAPPPLKVDMWWMGVVVVAAILVVAVLLVA